MRALLISFAAFGLALSAALALAQDAPAAAPVPTVTTAAVPSGAPEYVKAEPGIGQPSGGYALQAPMTSIAREAQHMTDNVLNPLMAATAIFEPTRFAERTFQDRGIGH